MTFAQFTIIQQIIVSMSLTKICQQQLKIYYYTQKLALRSSHSRDGGKWQSTLWEFGDTHSDVNI